MKSCPTCGRTYADDSLTYCLIDGAVLSAPHDSQSTASSSEPRQTNPHTAQTEYYDSHRGQPTIQSPAQQHNYGQQSWAGAAPPPQRRRGNLLLMAVAALLLVAFGAALAIVLNRAGVFGGSNSSNGVKEKETAVSNNSSNDNASSQNKQSTTTNGPAVATSTPTPASTPSPTPTPTPTPVPSLNIVGTWTGKYTTDPGTLIISSQNGNNVSGTLNSGGYLIAVSGTVNPTTRAVVLRETSVLKRTTTQYANWRLGVNSGTVSADGKRMSGRGKASGQAGYSWSFTKQ